MQQILAFAGKLLVDYSAVLLLSGTGVRSDDKEFERLYTRWRVSARMPKAFPKNR